MSVSVSRLLLGLHATDGRWTSPSICTSMVRCPNGSIRVAARRRRTERAAWPGRCRLSDRAEAPRGRRRPRTEDRARERCRGRASERERQGAPPLRTAPRSRRSRSSRTRRRRRPGNCRGLRASPRASSPCSRARSASGVAPDRIQIRIATVPEGFVAGEETALINAISGGPPRPTTTPPRPFERGLDGRPTLVQNVETLAQLALIAAAARSGSARSARGTSPEARSSPCPARCGCPGCTRSRSARRFATSWQRLEE